MLQGVKRLIDVLFSASKASTVRRVLPEHEGKYKISLPTGTTAKSRAIIAKMQSDKSENKSIFDRLTSNNVSDVEITSTSEPFKKTKETSSIFNRLGNYKELELEKKSIAFSGTFKSSPTVSF